MPDARADFGSRLPVLPPVAALVEIAVLFAALLIADWMLPNVELADIRPHPFWLPVLLLSMQYGTVSGLLAAAVAIGLTAAAGFPEQGPTETYFTYLIKIWIEPILWIGAAVLIGQFRMRQISRKQQLVFQVTELSSQRAAIADYARNLRTHCNALERQIAGRQEPDLMLALQAIEFAHEQGAATGDQGVEQQFSRVMTVAVPGARSSLHALDDAGLRLVATTGIAAEQTLQTSIAATDPLHAAMSGGHAVSVLTRDGETSLAGHGLVAVPVRMAAAAGGSRIVGMLKIEQIDPALLVPSIVPALATIARAFAPALAARVGDRQHAGATAPGAPQASVFAQQAPRFMRHLRWLRGRVSAAPEAGTTARPRTTTSIGS